MTGHLTAPDTQDLAWIDAAPHDALDSDFPAGVDINWQKLGLFLLSDEVHVLVDVCPHA